MKFLCDRCKTRYSIADERVRGKILKIRCKNCANVISVREGMTDEDASIEAPSVSPSPAASGSALQNAFASVMVGTRPGETQPPPPVLEEEWYVAIDGNQAGPFTLAEAQAWVGGKQPLDDLFCWCEGFDDWLPVEKVSHFRGLRGRREETPRPKAATGSRAVVAPAASAKAPAAAATPAAAKKDPARETRPQVKEPIDEEPKPLFAATLAKLEADAAKKDDGPGDKKAADKKPADKKPEPKIADKKPTDDRKPADAKDDKLPARGPGSLSPLSPVTPRAPLPMPTRAAAPVASAAPVARAGAQAAVASARTPLAALAREEANQAPALAPAPTPAPKPAAAKAGGSRRPMFDTGEPDHEDEGEALDDSALEPDDDAATDGLDLDIGEVSRVVRLPDIMSAGRPSGRAQAQRPMGRMSGASQAVGRGSGASPAISAAASAALGGAVAQGPDGEALPPLSDAVLADAQPQLVPSVASRRNHHVMWLIGGAVLLLGVVVVIAVAASASGADEGPVSTGNLDVTGLGYSYDPLRPHGSGGSDEGTGAGSVTITGTHIIRHNQGSGGNTGSQQIGTGSQGSGRQEIGPNGEPIEPLTGDDIVNVSNRMSMGTARCYERALKKDPFLKVQKIMVSLKVDATGLVTDVALDSHTTDDLGQCIMGAIRRWPFRRSTEGINTVFPLVFQQGG